MSHPFTIFNPSDMISILKDILPTQAQESDFYADHVEPVLTASINHVLCGNMYVFSQYGYQTIKRLEQELFPIIRESLEPVVVENTIRCRIEFLTPRTVKLFCYVKDEKSRAEMLLERIERDIDEGDHQYPKYILDIINDRTLS